MAYEHIDEWVEDYRDGDAAYEVNRAFYPHPQLARQAIGFETALSVAREMAKQFNDVVIMVAWAGRDDTEQLPVCLIYDKKLLFEVRFTHLLDHIFETEAEKVERDEEEESPSGVSLCLDRDYMLAREGDEPYEPDNWGAHYE